MKKLLLLLLITSTLFMSCVSTKRAENRMELPNPSCHLIDLKTIGYPEDYVKFHNCTSDENIDIRVYVFDQWRKSWEFFGVATLDDFDDIDTIFNGPFSRNDLDHYRYVAIQFRSGRDYDFSISNIRDDLHVYLFDKEEW